MSQHRELNVLHKDLVHGALVEELAKFVLLFVEQVLLKFLQNSYTYSGLT